MNKGKITTKFLSLLFVLTLGYCVFSAFSVCAEPDETYAIESYVATDDEADKTEGESSTAQASTETKSEPTYRAPLPTVENTKPKVPEVVGAVEDREEPSLFWGFVSWILVGIGAAVIFAVVLSTKAKAYRGGRDRYSTTDKISGKKKLLSQDYYDKRKRR